MDPRIHDHATRAKRGDPDGLAGAGRRSTFRRGPRMTGNPGRPAGPWGFTLIELIGVMAVLVILSVALVPVATRIVDRAAGEQETKVMQRLAQGLQRHVLLNRQVPDHTSYATAIAAVLGCRESDVRYNSRGQGRVYLIDPALRIGTNSSQVLPFTQNSLGSIQPVAPRMLLLSSLSAALPATVVSGVAESTNAFNAIWDVAEDAVPSGWVWNGVGSDLRIQRINLSPLFTCVVLNSETNALGRYAIDAVATNALPGNPFTAYYLRGTVLGLHGTNNVSQASVVLQEDVSFFFEQGFWRSRFYLGRGIHLLRGEDLQAAADLFLATPANANAKQGVTQNQVINVMMAFMTAYLNWAYDTTPFRNGQEPSTEQADMATQTKNYIFKPSS